SRSLSVNSPPLLGQSSFVPIQLVPYTMAARGKDTNMAGSSEWVCVQCQEMEARAQERERELLDELQESRALTEKYKAELTVAQSTIQKMKEATHNVEATASLLRKVETLSKQMSLQHEAVLRGEKKANLLARRRSSEGYTSGEPEPMLPQDAPASLDDKKWWKGEGPAEPCPRGCYYLENTRQDHYKTWHYNAYYAF
ncbi:hypothetical protein PMAYCL1PPCAC_21597, partial [Pristionchus mayeri]